MPAAKARFHYRPVSIGRALLVTDVDEASSRALPERVRRFAAPLGPDTQWHTVEGRRFSSVGELLGLMDENKPDLICTYRNLHSSAWQWPYSLGEYVDVLTQVVACPVLLLPHPREPAGGGFDGTDVVMAVTVMHKHGVSMSFGRFIRLALPFAAAQIVLAIAYVLLLL